MLLGGFAVNGGWCLFLNAKNKTTGDYLKSAAPLVTNFIFAGLAGAIWCSQFICFKTGEPAMGNLSYVGWSVLMASVILFIHFWKWIILAALLVMGVSLMMQRLRELAG